MSAQQVAMIEELAALLSETRRLRDAFRQKDPSSQRLGILERDVCRLERQLERMNDDR